MVPGLGRRFAHFLYWIGPWAQRSRAPAVVRRPLRIAAAAKPAWLYAPARGPIAGAWLISPGLHYDGPDDPRMDRFAAILAGAGHLVLAPAIPDLMQLRLTPAVTAALCDAFDTLARQPELRPDTPVGVFSVSVGSLGALRLASHPAYAQRVARVVCLGGYATPRDLEDALLGRNGPRDPLNRPMVFLTAIDRLDTPIRDPDALADAWRRYIRATWPRLELKSPKSRAHVPVAEEIAESVCAEDRTLFLMGCGARPGGENLCDAARDRHSAALEYLDPLAEIESLRARVDLVHGVLDRVIPYSQLALLKAAIPHARTYSLRLFAHSAAMASRRYDQFLAGLAGDLLTVTRIAWMLARGP